MKAHNSFSHIFKILAFGALMAVRSSQAATLTVSPSSVSNGYNGYITLQIGGVPSGAGVVVQKFFDANSNGVVDAGDLLVQQGNPQDGKTSPVIGGVTNFNVPGDNDGSANGSITAKILFNNGDFIQKTFGQYLFVVSSTNGAFTPLTNLFSVTNLPYLQKITGTVTNNTGAAVPNAVVILFPPPRTGGDHGPGTPVGAGVANGSGVYAIPMPVGGYVPMALRSNYFANYSTSPLVTLTSGQTLTTNLVLSNATANVSGTFVDATNSSRVLAGMFTPLTTSGGLITAGFTDSNGNFNVPVPTGQTWGVGSDASGLIVHGYVGYENDPTNVSSGATGVTVGFARESALFYGTVLDPIGNPVPGIAIEAYDNNNNIYQQDGWTDTNGNYVVAAVGGLGVNDQWQVQVDQNPTNYVFSQPALQQNGGTNIAISQAVQVNFTAVPVTGAITGHVQYNGSPVVGVGVSANVFTNGKFFQPNTAHTDNSGNYTLYVANASWSVSLNCNGGSDSLSQILGGSFNCPQSQNINIANNTGTANFTVSSGSGGQFGDFEYTVDNGAVTISGYTGSGGPVTIPDTINGMPVTSIGDSAFESTAVTSVILGTNVTSVGVDAFVGCFDLTNVTIPNGVTTLEDGAFEDAALTSVSIPASVTSIGETPFSGNNGLLSINVDSGNPAYKSIGGVLFDHSLTTLIEYPQGSAATFYSIPNSVTNIEADAFAGAASLTGVTIPNSVISIEDYAFAATGLTNVTIPASVASIGGGPFDLCNYLSAISVATNNPNFASVAGVLFSHDGSKIIQYPDGNPATSYVIPNGVKDIGQSAFDGSSTLTNVTIPGGVTNIEVSAFYQCFGLVSVTIPGSVSNIGILAFAYCPNLKSVYFDGNPPTADSSSFLSDNNATAYYMSGATGWSSTYEGLPTALFSATGGAPTLSLIPYGADIILAWPTNASGFSLQVTTNFIAPVAWGNVSSKPVVVGGDNLVIISTSGTRQFYRLSK